MIAITLNLTTLAIEFSCICTDRAMISVFRSSATHQRIHQRNTAGLTAEFMIGNLAPNMTDSLLRSPESSYPASNSRHTSLQKNVSAMNDTLRNTAANLTRLSLTEVAEQPPWLLANGRSCEICLSQITASGALIETSEKNPDLPLLCAYTRYITRSRWLGVLPHSEYATRPVFLARRSHRLLSRGQH